MAAENHNKSHHWHLWDYQKTSVSSLSSWKMANGSGCNSTSSQESKSIITSLQRRKWYLKNTTSSLQFPSCRMAVVIRLVRGDLWAPNCWKTTSVADACVTSISLHDWNAAYSQGEISNIPVLPIPINFRFMLVSCKTIITILPGSLCLIDFSIFFAVRPIVLKMEKELLCPSFCSKSFSHYSVESESNLFDSLLPDWSL